MQAGSGKRPAPFFHGPQGEAFFEVLRLVSFFRRKAALEDEQSVF
jgi:hypothetical protein